MAGGNYLSPRLRTSPFGGSLARHQGLSNTYWKPFQVGEYWIDTSMLTAYRIVSREAEKNVSAPGAPWEYQSFGDFKGGEGENE
ncbi:hypothetical protein PJI16_03475 [Nitrospira sp. MA-1]|nr:hypothetical protein [Nitrospira sp. MA-1]